MAVTPEELEQIKAELATRMGGAPTTPGSIPSPKAPTPAPLGQSAEGGMGFGDVKGADKAAAPSDSFDPNAGFKFDPAAGAGGGAMGGLAAGLTGSMGMANALRKGGKTPFEGIKKMFADDPQVPETTPLEG